MGVREHRCLYCVGTKIPPGTPKVCCQASLAPHLLRSSHAAVAITLNKCLALFNAINAFRASKKLTPVLHSKSLQLVAATHVSSLVSDYRQIYMQGACTAHSWFSGPYACCFNNTYQSSSW